MARQNHKPLTDEEKQAFLNLVGQGYSDLKAAVEVGRNRFVFSRLRKTDEEFAAAYEQATGAKCDTVRDEIRSRAFDREDPHSWRLLLALAGSLMPEFRTGKVEVSGNDGKPVQVEVKHSVDDLARVASILADAGALSS